MSPIKKLTQFSFIPTAPKRDNGEMQKSHGENHGVLASVINRGGRMPGRFAGIAISNQGPVLFANTLVNFASGQNEKPDPGFWRRIGSRPGQ